MAAGWDSFPSIRCRLSEEKVVARPCLLEPHRSPLRSHHVVSSMTKLRWVHQDHLRRMKKSSSRTPPPWLWILTPRASPSLLRRLRLTPILAEGDRPAPPFPPVCPGFYSLGPVWQLGVIVIKELPETPETLLLRLLGSGQTQIKAAQELAGLDPSDPRRPTLLDLMARWRIFLDKLPAEREDEQEVTMFLRTAALEAFEQKLEQRRQEGLSQGLSQGRSEGRNEGLSQGRREGLTEGVRTSILRAWRRRFGPVPSALEVRLERIHSPTVLEEILDRVVEGQHRDETLALLLKFPLE